MRINAPSITKRVTASFLSFLLVLSSVSTAMPFFISDVASAAPGIEEILSGEATQVNEEANSIAEVPGEVAKSEPALLNAKEIEKVTTPTPFVSSEMLTKSMGINALAADDNVNTVCPGECDYTSVQEAIDASTSGDTVSIGEGIYSAPQFLVLAAQAGITIKGAGAGQTTLNLNAASDGFKVQANNVTLKNFTITTDPRVANYGLRAQGVTSLTVEGVTISKMMKSGFDINGMTDSTFTNITAQGNGGVGVAVTDSNNLSFDGVTTSGSGWNAGVMLATKGGSYLNMCGVNGVTFSDLSISEATPIYTDFNNTNCAIQNVAVPSTYLPYKVSFERNASRDVYVRSLSEAVTLASTPPGSTQSPVISSTDGSSYVVAQGMSIQDAINAAAPGAVINVASGTYIENVNVNKDVSLIGEGKATTKIVATDANATPVTFNTTGATVSGFTITHDYTQAEKDNWNFNNNGVAFNQGGNTLTDNEISLSRNGIYVNNTQNNVIDNNVITNNRTGINLTNTIDGTKITNNIIKDNWTLGLVYYSQGLPTDFSTLTVTGNTFDKNWYSELVIKDAQLSTGTLDVTNNTFTDNPVTRSEFANPSLNEPSFVAQKPVALGGTAQKPATEFPTIRIYNSAGVTLVYAPVVAEEPTNPAPTPTPIPVATTNTVAPVSSLTSNIISSSPASDLGSSMVGALGVTPQGTDDQDTLGAETEKKAAKTPIVESSDDGWKIMGIAWYWWLLVLAAMAALWWFLVGRRRRDAEEN